MPALGKFGVVLFAGLAVVAVAGGLVFHDAHLLASVAPVTEPAPAAPQATSSTRIQELMNQISDAFEQAADKVSAFVVPIYSEEVVVTQNALNLPEDPFRQFFGDQFFKKFFNAPPQKQTVHSLGSGVIVSADGHILTNNHVVKGATKLTVLLTKNKNYNARVVGTDTLSDLAVIKIDASGLPFAVLGDSDKVQVGQWVIAVGNPFALLHTVTHGIISAKGRAGNQAPEPTYESFLQTDAPINPGNSGGALADMDGNVIGINTAIASPSGGNVGLGFAIPINTAKSVLNEILTKGKVVRGYLGILPQDITEGLAQGMKLKSTAGALVAEVTPGSAADRAGFRVGDVIVAYDGKKVEDSLTLRGMTAATAPGTTVKVDILRDGRPMTLTATVSERPAEPTEKQPTPQPESPETQASRQLGLTVQNLTPDIAKQLGYDNAAGALVTGVAPGSAADDAGLEKGDLIVEVNRVAVKTARDFEKLIRELKKGDTAVLLVRDQAGTQFVSIKIP